MVLKKDKNPNKYNSVTITLEPDKKIVQVSQGRSLLDELLRIQAEIDHSCGGMGSCSTCRVFVEQGLQALNPRNEVESEIAMERGFSENERLCCQSMAVEGLIIRRPKGKFFP